MLQEHLQESSASKSLLVITNGDDAYPLKIPNNIYAFTIQLRESTKI